MLERPHNFNKGEELTVEITGLTDRGLGTAQVEALVGPQKEHKVYEIFVRKALPGDKLRVVLDHARRTRCTGHWVEMIEPSSLRIEPRCPHFGRREVDDRGCGGCSYQSMSYRHQLAVKEKLIKEEFIEQGLDPGLVFPVKAMEEPWYYRNKMDFSFGDTADHEFGLGMHPTGYRHELINLEECFLQSPFVSTFVSKVRQWAIDRKLRPYLNINDDGFLLTLTIREGKRTGERMVNLMTTAKDETVIDGESVEAQEVAHEFCEFALQVAQEMGEPISSLYWTQKRAAKGETTRWMEHHLYGEAVLRERLEISPDRALQFEIHPRAFFQPNTKGAELLYREVIERAGLAGEDRIDTVVDLYCGTGTIGLCVAPWASQVFGIELRDDAVENARKNADFNDIDNIDFFAGDVGEVLESGAISGRCDGVDLTIVDPPRRGLLPAAIAQVLEIGAPRLVYVSCNPSSLAENLVELIDGGYQLEVVQPIDMFPQTFHVECVAVLQR